MELKFRAVFDGLDAESSRLEAYPAAQSLEGLTWALSLTVHYGVTGELRGRGDLSRSAKILIGPPRRGSVYYDIFVVVQENPFLAGIVGGYAANSVTPYINGLISTTFNMTLGLAARFPRGASRFLRRLNGDDLEDLAVRIEPPLTRAHSAIGRTASTLEFRSRRAPLVLMNQETKNFLEAELSDDFEVIDTNVTSFNLLTGNGRLYYPDTECTVPFSLHTSPLQGAKNALIKSMEHYAMGHEGTIRITARRFETADQRIKKFVVNSAEDVPQVDWVGGLDPIRQRRR